MFESLRKYIRKIKQETLTLCFVARDKRTRIVLRCMALLIAAYALSPIDLIPDFIPIIGLLDDLLLIVAGFSLVIKLTDHEIVTSARDRALAADDRPVSYGAAVCVVMVWLFLVWLFLI